jgi:acetoin utilization deacetylase AcuC-like enzyme
MPGASCLALQHGVACAPVSGFHHAGYYTARGFCTFNGLMAAAVQLRKDSRVHRVMILDLDQHYGDGTDDILQTVADRRN